MAQTPTTQTENKLPYVIAILAVLGLIAVSFFQQSTPINVNTSPDNQRDVISVSGTKDLQVMPDQAEISLQVITNASTAAEASKNNKDLVGKVIAEVMAEGIAKTDIETTSVYLNKLTDWDYKNQRQVDNGYQQVTTLKVTVKDLDNVGKALDAAIAGGANSINDVSFSLTKDAEAAYKKEAIDDAAAQAKEKAQLLANAAGTQLGKVVSLSESSYNYQPYYYRGAMMDSAKAEGTAGAPTPINPEKVSLSVTVSISYELN